MTPRKGLKPKFSYFSQHANGAGPSKKESSSQRNDVDDFEWPTWPAEDPYPSPDADVLIDSVMCRILGSPYEGLHPRFNGVLLQIFEGFRSLADEKQRLLAKAEQDSDRVSEMEKVMQKSAKQWNGEKQEYKAEIKRLELMLAKGKGGLAEVTLARQDSLLRIHQAERSSKARKHDTLETIFQFMEKNKKHEEKVWNNQRGRHCSSRRTLLFNTDTFTATMRRKSPSADMRRLSKTLMSQGSSYPDLPSGTLTDGPSTLAEASYLEARSLQNRTRAISDPKTSFSEDDTISTFSCAGDMLSDEAGDANFTEAAGIDNDFVAVTRIAKVLARRRNVDANVIMPKLLEMFAVPSNAQRPEMAKAVPPRAQTSMGQSSSMPPTRKNTKLMAKASGFFHKLKPQMNIDTTVVENQRFSFEEGDDSAISAPGATTPRAASSSALATMGTHDRVLRKCASTPLLADYKAGSDMNSPERPLSPVAQSPTGSTPVSESRRGSKIPTPVYNPGTLARPRRERESSESSLLTAIRCSETAERRSNSLSSSGYSSSSTSRMDMTAGSQGTTSNRLLEHTMALRGNAFAAAAAARAVESTNADSAWPVVHEKRSSVQKVDMSERRKENARPMNAPGGHVDREDLH